jgi:hypothetical protein
VALYPISDGPHNDGWKSLLGFSFAVIDEVVRKHNVPFPIQIGGGSMLLRRYGHRKSKDLDLFVTDTRLVKWCSPRLNDAAADIFPDYGEDSVTTKLMIGMQEIDIISASPIIEEDATEDVVLNGRSVLVERPREVLAKKVVYRGRQFQPRDVFDMACIAQAEPEEIGAIVPWISIAHVIDLEARLNEMGPIIHKEIAQKVEAYPAFSHVCDTCLSVAKDVVGNWKTLIKPAVEPPPYPEGYRVTYSKDGRTVVIKNVDAAGRANQISNPLGPAMVSIDKGPRWYIDGEELSESEWHQRTRKV